MVYAGSTVVKAIPGVIRHRGRGARNYTSGSPHYHFSHFFSSLSILLQKAVALKISIDTRTTGTVNNARL